MKENLIGARFIAYIIDVVLVGSAYSFLISNGADGIVIFLVLLYEPIFMFLFSATLGKLFMGLKVVSFDGSRISGGQIVGRWLARCLSQILYIGYIVAIFREDHRALHDILANTQVVES